MRAKPWGVLAVAILSVCLAACAGPYSAPPERLVMPKKEKKKPGAAEAPVFDEKCKADFKKPAEKVRTREQRRRADSLAQDADNLLAGIESASKDQRIAQATDAINKAADALAVNPYSPSATFTMATAYAWAGKKKCATLMLERLKDLSQIPDEVDDAIKYKDKVKTHPSFEPFRKDAEGAVGN
jgi:hypothetical protein